MIWKFSTSLRVGTVLIDIFIKFCLVVPVKSKQPADVLAGMMEGMKQHSRKPKLIYSDEEGSLKSEVALSYLKEEKIELHRLLRRSYAHSKT